MGNLKLQAEVLQLSSYCEVIKSIFNDNKELAVPKVLVYSYLIKKQNLEKNKIYNANNTKDVIYKSLSLLSGDKYFFNEVEFIIKAIDLLVKNNILSCENGILFIPDNDGSFSNVIFEGDAFLKMAIRESKKMSDKQFLKEVLSNV